jgi:phage tail-like protein
MSTRGIVKGLPSPFPIGLMLPALFQSDDFSQRFTRGLDEVISPVFSVLDCFDAYLDPGLAPLDFLAWLATWVGVSLDENWPLERQRSLINRAVEL